MRKLYNSFPPFASAFVIDTNNCHIQFSVLSSVLLAVIQPTFLGIWQVTSHFNVCQFLREIDTRYRLLPLSGREIERKKPCVFLICAILKLNFRVVLLIACFLAQQNWKLFGFDLHVLEFLPTLNLNVFLGLLKAFIASLLSSFICRPWHMKDSKKRRIASKTTKRIYMNMKQKWDKNMTEISNFDKFFST